MILTQSNFSGAAWREALTPFNDEVFGQARIEAYLDALLEAFPPNVGSGAPVMTMANPTKAAYALSSAWQKSIRRGLTAEACLYGCTYREIDADRFWRRLPVVAIEDIGLGNPALVHAIFWVAGKKAWRAHRAPDWRWAYAITRALCVSVKDRTCCDLCVCAESDPDLAGFREFAFDDLSGPELIDYVLDQDAYLVKRMIALWALAGTKVYRGGVPEKRDPKKGWLAFVKNQEPSMRAITVQGGNKTQDAMPLAFSLLYDTAWNGGALEARTHVLPAPRPAIRGLPDYTFDMHTGLGKKALRYMAMHCPPVWQFLEKECGITDPDEMGATLGGIMFRVESACLDTTLIYEGSEAIYGLCETARFRFRGVPLGSIKRARAVAVMNLPWLHYARRFVAGTTKYGEATPSAYHLHEKAA